MSASLRVSVRGLVSFTYFPEDIMPSGGFISAMAEGARAHRSRQKELPGMETEKPVSLTISRMGAEITLFGRMDAYLDGDVPLIEEIKLGGETPAPLPEHEAQALIYAAMTALGKPCERAEAKVTYVDADGARVCGFSRVLTSSELETGLYALLDPWLAYELSELSRRERRDAEISALAFPYEAYRAGQRELAVQAYTAIKRRRRLFACVPTGAGKSAAVLYPALKALSEGLTNKIIYLTARTPARQSPVNCLSLIRESCPSLRVSTLTAKEKLCPYDGGCRPSACERAKGHFLRQDAAVEHVTERGGIWDDDAIIEAARLHSVCPFEFALRLSELADVTLMDYNYAFDPAARVQRLFGVRRDMTLLIDEAHHLLERTRESLSGELSSAELTLLRREFGRGESRKHPFYKALTALINALRELPPESGRLGEAPEAVIQAALGAFGETMALLCGAGGGVPVRAFRMLAGFAYAAEHLDEDYAVLLDAHGRERALSLYCLLPGKEIAAVTKRQRGAVMFSATLNPLPVMKELLGGDENDACFSLPSPFPPENLSVSRMRVDTRYRFRDATARYVARAIAQAASRGRGKRIAYFPSYIYLRMVEKELRELDTPPLLVQGADMDNAARERFMEAFTDDDEPLLALCVLGGAFAEGIDLPGRRLSGVIVVGVGLPVPSGKITAQREYYQARYGDGFGYACRIPGMQKVLQAAGRVIRTETDTGALLLIDARYFEREYAELLPPYWDIKTRDALEVRA